MEKTELMQVVKLLDKIIASNNEEIKNAFRELLIVAALTETTNDDNRGPLASLIFAEIDILHNELKKVKHEVAYHLNSTRTKSYYEDYARAKDYNDRAFTNNKAISGSIADGLSSVNWSEVFKNKKI